MMVQIHSVCSWKVIKAISVPHCPCATMPPPTLIRTISAAEKTSRLDYSTNTVRKSKENSKSTTNEPPRDSRRIWSGSIDESPNDLFDRILSRNGRIGTSWPSSGFARAVCVKRPREKKKEINTWESWDHDTRKFIISTTPFFLKRTPFIRTSRQKTQKK